ncbi:MAG: tRNA lysidine(34) synthetase TilS [Sphaerochaeta sp.]|nr:tRNA lysidine(34) synthetase TilS [Sphaerochaeta sp.]
MSTIVEQVLRILERFFDEEGIDRNQEMAVAFSGGSDSLALLHAVSTLVGAERVHALYVNHHLRSSEELSGEIELNEHNCRLLGVSFTLLDLGHGSVERALKERGRGVEEAARQLRYDILGRTCRERSIPYLLTAHNSDDQLETLLMRVAQASSIASLASIRRRRDLEGVTVLRPVLEVSHSDLALYARTQGLTWSLDSTNDEDTYLRNALRREVKKPLLALFPNARSAAVVLGRRFEETSRLLDLMVEEALGSVICDDGVVSFTLVWYRSLVDELRELLLYRMVALVSGEERIARTIIAELVKGIDELERAGGGVREIGSLRIESREGMITLSPIAVLWSYCLPLDEPMKAQRIALPGDAEVVIREFVEGYWDTDALRIDASSLKDPVIRSAQGGDEIALSGGTMRVAKLLSSMKVALHQRGSVPILVDRSGVVAVFARAFGGRDRIAERFKAPLAHPFTNIYSSNRRNRNSEI